MKAAELNAPIGINRKEPIRIHVGMPAAILFTALVFAPFFGWMLVVDDPLGGEPRVTMPIAPVVERRAAEAAQGRPASTSPDAPSPARAGEGGRTTVQIMSPGPNGQMTVRRVEVPSEIAPTAPTAPPPPTVAPATQAPIPPPSPQRRAAREVPDPDLIDKVGAGMLPRIGPDGTRPWRAYARPTGAAPPAGAGRIAILVTGVGLSSGVTEAALSRLPPEVAVALSPYANQPQAIFERARQNGREAWLQIPMEPFDFPASDPGPQTLLVGTTPAQNIERLRWSMARLAGYVGVVPLMGSRFVATPEALRPVLEELKARGVAVLDDGATTRGQTAEVARAVGVAHARANAVIDASPNPELIDEALAALEARAREQGSAIGVASALPISLERITRWRRDLERRGFQLVAPSALLTPDR